RAEKLAEAAEEFERAASLDLVHAPARIQLAQLYRKMGEDAKAASAAAAVKRIRAQAPSVDRDRGGLLYRQGKMALERNQLNQAIGYLKEALETSFDELQVRITLGVAWLRTGNNSAAAVELRRALDLDPRSADAHLNLGV